MTNPSENQSQDNVQPVEGAETKLIEPNNKAPKNFKSRLVGIKNWYSAHKKLAIPLTILAIIVLLMVIPYSRYKILGLFIKKDVIVFVVDNKSDTVVSDAEVNMGSSSAKTNGRGVAELKDVPVGQYQLQVSKKHFTEFSQNVTVTTANNQVFEARLEATGRPVQVKVSNKINKQAVEGISIKAGEAEAKTDEKGMATLVLAAGTTTTSAELSGEGFLTTKVEIKSDDANATPNNFEVTPSGKVFFLSKSSGKIDVVKTNLDGSERQLVLAGTGKEQDFDTILLASRDWKYLALHSRRDDNPPKLYLIETQTGKLTTMDEGDASFNLVGWSNDKFIYTVTRNAPKQWESKKYALKSYDAPNKKIILIDETVAVGNQSDFAWQIFGSTYIIDSNLIYEKDWSSYNFSSSIISDKKDAIMQSTDTGANKKTVKDFQNSGGMQSYIQSYLFEPREIHYQTTYQNQTKYFKYTSDGQFKEDAKLKDDFEKNFGPPGYYKPFLLSPSSKEVFWSEDRDGKRAMFLGNQDAQDQKQIATIAEGKTYGWYGEQYLLVSKKSSELYVMSRAGLSDESALIKISDYHRPANTYYSFSYGYGGL